MKEMACPYCDVDIKIDDIENEDGCCPECGAMITAFMVEDEDTGFEKDEKVIIKDSDIDVDDDTFGYEM